jgi:GWxTD domain-containing protein
MGLLSKQLGNSFAGRPGVSLQSPISMGSRGFRIAVTLLVLIGCCFASQRYKGKEKFEHRFEPIYRWWLEDDVRYIITSEEAAAFRSLTNDEERDRFVETFWYRRDPTPETVENEFKLEHYRRIVFANQKYGTKDEPGRNTDRGQIYIVFGPPDQHSNETDASGLTVETWTYWKSAQLANGATLKFIDQCKCGTPRLTLGEESKNNLLNVEPTMPRMFPAPSAAPGIQIYAGPSPHATVHLKQLESALNTKISVGRIPFTVEHVGDEPATDLTSLTSICLEIDSSGLTSSADGLRADVFGRVLSMTGRVVAAFEKNVTRTQSSSNPLRTCQTLPVRIGVYRLDVAVKDINSDRLGISFTKLRIGMPARSDAIGSGTRSKHR